MARLSAEKSGPMRLPDVMQGGCFAHEVPSEGPGDVPSGPGTTSSRAGEHFSAEESKSRYFLQLDPS